MNRNAKTALTSLVVVAAALVPCTARAQSLFNRGEHPMHSLYADDKAHDRGDVVTIVIHEQQRIKNDEKSTLEKTTSLDAALSKFGIKPNAFNLPVDATYDAKRKFDGAGTYNKDGSFETSLGAVVIDVLPNGNLVIDGRRKIKVDRETKSIKITGIVRPRDVSAANSVQSENVANASVEYEGDGPLTDTTNKGWFETFLDFIWPF
ncbi:MAG: flagellar basal body L-ring protein FlgH [Planctomycetes bacterium]|nr:flagellar basal body L-ring protein FlgH [Planctomycetota bacterium]